MEQDAIILYVDDNLESRMIMDILLGDDLKLPHYMILGEEADLIEAFQRLPRKPNIIFLDIHMSPVDGFAMLAIIRKDPDYQHIPILAMTASVTNEEVQIMKRAGFSGLIAKPIHQTSFRETLRQIMEGEEVWQI
jgi:CheY-like chemotaxis protein